MKKKVLISVSNKDGIVRLAKELDILGWEVISTGGTGKVLKNAGIKITPVAKITKNPEAFDGRMKTISFQISSALLFDRDNPKHRSQAKKLGIEPIDMVVNDLYPFTEVIKKEITEETAIENIDIGGPTMIRAAAKNHKHVTVVTSKDDYGLVLGELKKYGETKKETRKKLALKVFNLMSEYDSAIFNYFSPEKDESLTSIKLRYGENPHQKGMFLATNSKDKLAIPNFKIIQGKELSFNNFLDIDSAINVISRIGTEKPASAVIKHGNPCGAALGKNIEEAFKKAWDGDPLAAFGGIIVVNREVSGFLAHKMIKNFFEVLLAPGISKEAEKIFQKKPNIRVLVNQALKKPQLSKEKDVKNIRGGILLQDISKKEIKEKDLNFVTRKKPTRAQIRDLLFAFKICEASKSNSITVVKGEQVLGNGVGATARIYSAGQALGIAYQKGIKGAVAASDGFFPFTDSVEYFKKANISAIIQPGGSKADQKVIEYCDKNNLAMAFTGLRGFKH